MNALDDKYNTPLDLMLPSNIISEVVQCFVCNGYNPNATIHRKSLLHFACERCDVKLIQTLIRHKADSYECFG